MMSVVFFISRVTFICGRAGVCALGAVAAKLTGDSQLQDRYLARFHEVPFMLCYVQIGFIYILNGTT